MTDTGAPMPSDADEREQASLLRRELDDVEHALGRLDAGTYGTCELCGEAIPDQDLNAAPQARVCAAHAA
jgi:DnaK suppressor protein